MTDSEKLLLCSGCRDNFYNGHNGYGIARCWMLDSAKPVKRVLVHINQSPPYKQAPITVLNCKHVQGYALLDPKDSRCVGVTS